MSGPVPQILLPWLLFLGLFAVLLAGCVWAAVIDGRRARRAWYR
ncbi:hypothetical protein [Phenylobacterium sp.]